jgi:nucleotide-binding universal stress UspA family protein
MAGIVVGIDESAHAREAVEELVAKSAGDLTGPKPPSVTVNVFTGFPVQALVDASNDAELIVVGSRGTGGFSKALLGSVSNQIAHHAGCPVVIVHTGK